MSKARELFSTLQSTNAWLELLPKEPYEKAVRLNSGLGVIATGDLTAKEESAALQALRPYVYQVIKRLSSEYRDTHLGWVDSTVESVSLVHKLLATQTTLFSNLVIKAHKEGLGQNEIFQLLHHFFVDQISLFITYFELYQTVPANMWLRLHKRYLLAEKLGAANFKIKDKNSLSETEFSVRNLYCVSLLLGSARTNQLSPEDNLIIAKELYKWSPLIQLSKTSDDEINSLVVDIATDRPPVFSRLSELDNSETLFFVNVDKLLSRFSVMIEIKNSEGDKAEVTKLSARLIRHLSSAWGEFVERDDRKDIKENITLCLGLENIYYYLSGNKTVSDFMGGSGKMNLSIAYESHENIELIEARRGNDIWSSFVDKEGDNAHFGCLPENFSLTNGFEEQGEFTVNEDHPVQSAVTIDKSLSGCSIQWPAEGTQNLEVGDIVGIRYDGDSCWSIGNIAWLVREDFKHFKAGIKILSTKATPVAVEALLGMNVKQHYFAGLLLPMEEGLTQASYLAVASAGFSEGKKITVAQKGQEEFLHLARTVAKSPTSILFECGYCDKIATS